MTDVNKVVLVGRITADIDSVQNGFSYTQGGTAVAKISIAVNRSRKQGEQWVDEAYFFNITVWGKTAENLRQYFKKGQMIAVVGYLKQDKWTDQQGNSRSSVSVVAEQIELCGQRGGGQDGAQGQQGGFNPNTAYQTAQEARAAAQGFSQPNQAQSPSAEAYPEDIPF